MIPYHVLYFHKKFGHPVRFTPKVPSENEIRFRLSLITEEFKELLESCLVIPDNSELAIALQDVVAAISSPYPYRRVVVKVNLPEMVDALADIDFVVEGTRLVFGVQGDPIANEVYRANMDKEANGQAKPSKPEDWEPPRVAELLKEQGWIETKEGE